MRACTKFLRLDYVTPRVPTARINIYLSFYTFSRFSFYDSLTSCESLSLWDFIVYDTEDTFAG